MLGIAAEKGQGTKVANLFPCQKSHLKIYNPVSDKHGEGVPTRRTEQIPLLRTAQAFIIENSD